MVINSISINDLSIRFKKEQILNRLSFKLKSGNITALIGPNGAGKSTCMKILAGLVFPDKGSFIINKGYSNTAFKALRNYGGYLIESPAFYPYFTAFQNLKVLQKLRGDNRNINELLQLVGLQNTHNKKVVHFSKGMNQRLGIAQALIGNPQFLILDEPFHGLDIEVKEELMGVIKNLAKKEGKAILISSHLLSDLEKIADDFVLLDKGQLYFSGKLNQQKDKKLKTCFKFRKPIAHKLMQELAVSQVLYSTQKSFCVYLTENESQLLLKAMTDKGYYPISIDSVSLLTQKYREISE